MWDITSSEIFQIVNPAASVGYICCKVKLFRGLNAMLILEDI